MTTRKRSHLFAFRCDRDPQVAELLESEENMSEVILRALREHYRREHAVTCPTCNGSGQVYNPIIPRLKPRPPP